MIKMNRRLIAYFSWSGNTEAIAEMIQEITGVDVFHIETVKPYPKGYLRTVGIAEKELKNDARP
jgi:flavodoxin